MLTVRDGGDGVQVFEFASPVTAEDLHRFQAARDEALGRDERHALVVDAQRVTRIPGPKGIQELIRWGRRRRAKLGEHAAGIAFVVRWGPLAKIVRAFVHMSTSPEASLYTDSLDEALDWSRDRVASPVPDRFDCPR